jgi:hypothetical protein
VILADAQRGQLMNPFVENRLGNERAGDAAQMHSHFR